jgi:hypothetical protein
MKYMLSTVQAETGTFETADDAVQAGMATGNDFVVITDAGTPHTIGMLITYKQQNGRKGKMWNISIC